MHTVDSIYVGEYTCDWFVEYSWYNHPETNLTCCSESSMSLDYLKYTEEIEAVQITEHSMLPWVEATITHIKNLDLTLTPGRHVGIGVFGNVINIHAADIDTDLEICVLQPQRFGFDNDLEI